MITSVGVLIISHSGVGNALLDVIKNTWGEYPLPIMQISIGQDPDPAMMITKASYCLKQLDSGKGVLVLTDMFGSSPSNIAYQLQYKGHAVRVLTGLNLPMLFRVCNYPYLPLPELAIKALCGGKEGIFEPWESSALGCSEIILPENENLV